MLRNNLLWCGMLMLCLVSCNRQKSPTLDKACYILVQERDTINLSFTVNESRVEGDLEFRFYEKDKSTGTINGEMKGDTLFADYEFMSEGMSSSREVAFLKKEDALMMGFGEVIHNGSKEVFKSRKDIKFGNGLVLRKCQ